MFFDHLLKNIDIAILEGIVTFGNNEGKFSRQIHDFYDKFKEAKNIMKKNDIINQYMPYFNNFATVFKVIRNIYSGSKRHDFINLIFTKFLPTIEQEYSPQSIDKYSNEAESLGLTKGKLTSAFSKIAFLYQPNLYFPYDKTARNALKDYLKEKRISVEIDRNYKNYSDIVYRSFDEFNQRYNIKDYIKDEKYLSKFKVNKNILDKRINAFIDNCKSLNIRDINDFICRRAFDKSLMIYGKMIHEKFDKNDWVVFSDNIILDDIN